MDQNEKKPVPYGAEDLRAAYEIALKHYGSEEMAKMTIAALLRRRGQEIPEEYR